jgi:hypothetical protein
VGVKVNLLSDVDAKTTEMGESSSSDSLKMSQRVNLHELGLHCSKQIAEQKTKVQHRDHVTYGARAKRLLKMFALICTVNTYNAKPSRIAEFFLHRIATLLNRQSK